MRHAGLLLKNPSYAQTVRGRTMVYYSRYFVYDFSVTDHFVNKRQLKTTRELGDIFYFVDRD
jgi:hypothetical protein